MVKKNNGRSYNVEKKQYNEEDGFFKGNSIKQNKRARSDTRVEKRR